jgi:hypothetical protein
MMRIANGQGFWGDWLEAPVRLIEDGPIDFLTLDYLAEVTMSILQKQRKQDPSAGYARDFPPLMGRIANLMKERGVRVVANAGGVNPIACAREVRRRAPDLKVAVVLGDDVLDRIEEFQSKGYELKNIDTGEPVSAIAGKILSANAYIGAFPLAEALAKGADVVITGRCADAALALAPMIHAYGWQPAEYDLLSAGTIAGHIVECGAQCTGGNCQVDWQSISDLANIGYPIIDMEADGTFSITKHKGTGGRVNSDVVKEQLLYEIGDPHCYIVPDCVADFTSIRLHDDGPDRVRVTGSRGAAPTPFLKLSISYAWGWKSIGTLVYSWPDALEKAKAADEIVRKRLAELDLKFDAINTQFFGVNACHGAVAAPAPDPPEVQVRIGVRGHDRKAIDRFTRELIPLVLSGPPTATGYGDGRPDVREVVAYWGALVPREEIQPRVEVVE